ncbi:N-acetylmuramic acid 6-phosphate etherase [Brachybacterium sp. DNPG3]
MTTWRDLLDLRSPTEERNPATADLDMLRAAELVGRLLDEDRHVLSAVRALTDELAGLVEACVAAIADGGTVHYVGAGTSGRLGVLDAAELPPTFGVDPGMVRAHLAGGAAALLVAGEGAEDSEAAGAAIVAEHCRPGDVVIGLAASGRTPYVAGALAAARADGLVTALIAANPQAPLAHLADHALLADVGPEAVTGSTRMKAGSAQKMLLNALSTAVMVRIGRTYSNLMVGVRAGNEKLVARTVRMLVQASGCSRKAAEAALAAADGEVRVALIDVLSGAGAAASRQAADRFPPGPGRVGDPAGIRSAVASLGPTAEGPTAERLAPPTDAQTGPSDAPARRDDER